MAQKLFQLPHEYSKWPGHKIRVPSVAPGLGKRWGENAPIIDSSMWEVRALRPHLLMGSEISFVVGGFKVGRACGRWTMFDFASTAFRKKWLNESTSCDQSLLCWWKSWWWTEFGTVRESLVRRIHLPAVFYKPNQSCQSLKASYLMERNFAWSIYTF